mmetsp:Transcript_16882/g.25229  ORF Transcript_16882/g.25229 Transcript_16882/m.25229 type:complete len:144 (-) Transcript_16882:477-908(-)
MPPPPPRPRTASTGSISCLLRATRTIGGEFYGTCNDTTSTTFTGPTEPLTSFTMSTASTHRRRAESLDENKHRNFIVANDPTLEMELRHGAEGGQSLDNNGVDSTDSEKLPFRKRSVSCSVVYSTSTSSHNVNNRSCETIMEE